jgi:hypothetical protein
VFWFFAELVNYEDNNRNVNCLNQFLKSFYSSLSKKVQEFCLFKKALQGSKSGNTFCVLMTR